MRAGPRAASASSSCPPAPARSQVWKIKLDGGEAEPVTDQPLDVGNLVVAQTGELLAFTMDVFPGLSPAETAKKAGRRSVIKKPRAGSTTGSSSAIGIPGATAGARTSSSCLEKGRRGPGPDAGDGRGRAQQALRRPGGDRLHAGRPGPCFHGARRRPRGSLVHEFRPLLRSGGRIEAAAVPDRREQGLGYDAGLLSGRQNAGVSRHVPSGLRGRPLPYRDQALARRRRPCPHGELGLLGVVDAVVSRRRRAPGDGSEQRTDIAVRG